MTSLSRQAVESMGTMIAQQGLEVFSSDEDEGDQDSVLIALRNAEMNSRNRVAQLEAEAEAEAEEQRRLADDALDALAVSSEYSPILPYQTLKCRCLCSPNEDFGRRNKR